MDFNLPVLPESVRLIVLAVLQGVAEFLPISSSGHLNVFSKVLGGEPSTMVNVALHFGTLLSILVFYRKRVLALLSSDRRVIPLLIVGTIPAAIVGVTIKKMFPDLLNNVLLTGIMLCITGVALCFFQPRKKTKQKSGDDSSPTKPVEISENKSCDYLDLTWKGALFIGVFQAFAIMPGISRSGFTILAGILIGLRHTAAATYSFLLAIPAILGATVLEILDLLKEKPSEPMEMVAVATVVAFVVGLASLFLLVKLLNQGKLHWFALWVLPLGLLVVIWQVFEQIAANGAF